MTTTNSLTRNTQYLLASVDSGLVNRPSHEILARAAGRLRDLIRSWWNSLEPEVTAGVSVQMMEDALVGVAERAVGESTHTVGRSWTKGSLNWKMRILQTEAEQVIAERFIRACERLGVLYSRGKVIGFAHDCLLEIYLGLGLLKTHILPVEVRSNTRDSLMPLQTPRGLATLAMLALASPDDIDDLFIGVASENLHLAAWFLYFNSTVWKRHGEWLAMQILGAMDWDISETSRQSLEAAFLSLGSASLNAARRLVDERGGSLTAYFAAIAILGQRGDTNDMQRLEALQQDATLGEWEITRLRHLIREAEALVFDEEARKRYEHEEGVEIAKQMAIFVLKTAGTIVARTATPSAQWNHDTKQWVTGQGIKGFGGLLGVLPSSEFLHQQAALRALLAQLPALIERRKVQIVNAAPRIPPACAAALEQLTRRARIAE